MKKLISPIVILDIRGLLLHMLHRGTDPNSILLKDGNTCNRAAYGFENFLEEYLLPLLENHAPIHIIAVWEGGRDYRKRIFPQYKASRDAKKEKEDPIATEQIKNIEDITKRYLANLGCINVSVNGVEGDDVIAMLCKAFKDTPKRIICNDSDLTQLADENTFISIRDEAVTGEYKGVPTTLIRLQKSIVGDSSDGYGGVPRVGEKAWEKLVETYGFDGMAELDQCVAKKDYTMLKEAIAETGDKVLQQILDNKTTWELMYDLAGLHPELCFGFSGKQKIQPLYYKRLPNRDNVMNIMRSTGTDDLFHRVERFMPTQRLADKGNLEDCFDLIDILMSKTPYVAFDYETYDPVKHQPFNEAMPATQRGKGSYVDVLSSEMAGASFTFGDNLQHTFYLPVEHKDTANVPKDMVKAVLVECVEKGKELIAHNANFEEQVTKQCLGLQLVRPLDTMIMSSYADENEDAGLKDLSLRLFRYEQETYKQVMQKASAEDMRGVSGAQVLGYGCDDAFVTAHLAHLFYVILKVEDTWNFYYENDVATTHVINRSFEAGARIDYDQLERLQKKDAATIEQGTKFIRGELEKHCSEVNFDRAMVLYKDQEDYLQAKYRDAGLDAEKIKVKLMEFKDSCVKSSAYVPHGTIREEVSFIPTPNKIHNLITMLGLAPEGYEFKSVSASKITEFLVKAARRNAAEGYPEPELEKDRQDFLAALTAAAGDPIKHRQGEQYQAFLDVALRILGHFAKARSVGDELNLDSPNQMQQLLYCKLGLPIRKRSKVQRGSSRDKLGFPGSPGTDSKAMNMAIAEDCPEGDWRREVLKKVIEVKAAMTRFELYYRPYPLWKHPKDGMIHPGIRNCGTVTRRPTGTSPNVLQVAKGETRTIFIPRYDDHVVIAIDFSGQELRITGSESRDKVLIDAYTGGGFETDQYGMKHPIIKDIHSVTACTFAKNIIKNELGADYLGLFNILIDGKMDYDQFIKILDGEVVLKLPNETDAKKVKAVITKCRKMAKIVNFLIIYGGTAGTLAMGLGVPTSFAEMIMDMVFTGYPRLGPWQKETIKFAYDHGYVKTAFGTWKHVSADIRSKDGYLSSRAERQAVNQTVQGCAADILKIVMTEAYKTRLFEETGSVLIAPVYDEIASSVPMKNAFEYSQRLQAIMNLTPPGHAIPMMGEVSLGLNWGEMEELGDNPAEQVMVEAFNKLKAKAA